MAVSEKTTTEMTVRVSTDLAAMVQAQVASGRYADPSAVVAEALREMDERTRQDDEVLDLLQQAEDQFDRGQFREWTPALLADISRHVDERLERGEVPRRPHVQP